MRREREALRESGVWTTSSSPAPLDPMSMFCAGGDDFVPNPGAFSASLDFSKPEGFLAEYFEGGSILGEFPGVMESELEDIIPGESIIPGMDQILASDTARGVSSAVCAAAALKIFCSEGLYDPVPTGAVAPVLLPPPLACFVEARGDALAPDGTVWKMSEPLSFAKSLVRTAKDLVSNRPYACSANHWLPTEPDDRRTKNLVFSRLVSFLAGQGINIPPSASGADLFSGIRAPWIDDLPLSPNVSGHIQTLFQTPMSLFFETLRVQGDDWFIRHLDLAWYDPQPSDVFVEDGVSSALDILSSWAVRCPRIAGETGLLLRAVDFSLPGSLVQVGVIIPSSDGVEVVQPYSDHSGQLTVEAALRADSFCTRNRPMVLTSTTLTRFDLQKQVLGLMFPN